MFLHKPEPPEEILPTLKAAMTDSVLERCDFKDKVTTALEEHSASLWPVCLHLLTAAIRIESTLPKETGTDWLPPGMQDISHLQLNRLLRIFRESILLDTWVQLETDSH